jgi:hemoglobin/transferrin/lactoferrin receptor protein
VFGRLAYTATFGRNDTTGEDLTSIPGHKLVLTLGGRAPEYDLEYGARATLVAATETGVVPADSATFLPEGAPAHASFDVFASWKPQTGAFAGTEAQFAIENIFDADYRDNQTPDRSLGRTFKLTLAKQFDY